MAATGACNSSNCQVASDWSFPVDYSWMSLSVCDSQSPEYDSTSFFFNTFPCECGWTCEKCPELIVAWLEFLWCQYLLKFGNNNDVILIPSGYSLSLKRRLSTRYSVVLQEKTAVAPQRQNNQSITARLTCTSFFLSFHSPPSLPHHFTTPSLPSHTPPSVSLSLSVFLFLSWAIGLLFMASPIEDALLYKTLEPSSRPTPFEDVAHNSYLGL